MFHVQRNACKTKLILTKKTIFSTMFSRNFRSFFEFFDRFLEIFLVFWIARGRLDPFGSIQIHPEAIRSDLKRFEAIRKNWKFPKFFRLKFLFFVIFGQFSKSYSKMDVAIQILAKNYPDTLFSRLYNEKRSRSSYILSW